MNQKNKEYIPYEELSADDHAHLDGPKNKLMRYYFYVEQGMGFVNDFRNLLLGIFALYFLLKLTNPIWMVAMFFIGCTGLMISGYYNVHYISKMREWLTVRFSTHYGIRNFNYSKGTFEMLEEIKNILARLEKIENGKNDFNSLK